MDRNAVNPCRDIIVTDVALRKESVDRNIQDYDTRVGARSRSPQGERG